MSYEERQNDPSFATPPGCESLSRRLLTLHWASRQLGYLERVKGCKTLNALRSELTQLLDAMNVSDNDILLQETIAHVHKLKSELDTQRSKGQKWHDELEDLKTKAILRLDNRRLLVRYITIAVTIGSVYFVIFRYTSWFTLFK